jgi:hypothetical protein
MAELHSDWAFLQAALPDLQQYLLSNDLYWPLRLTAATPGGRQTPQLTIGSLALSRARLAALDLSTQEKSELAEIVAGIERVRDEWRANWARKAAAERDSRLNLWQQYLRELRADTRQQAAYYATEVRQRAILDLLEAELLDGVPPGEAEQMAMLDTVLRGQTRPGAFVWEPEVARAFAQEKFWYLYRSPKA